MMSCEQSAFGKVELAHVLAEVGLRCFAEAIDGETAELPEIDLVGVHGEDLLLGEAMLENDADDGFTNLARVSALGRKEESSRQLLRERGRAFL